MKLKSSKIVAFLLTFIILISQIFTGSFAFANNANNVNDKVPFTIFHTNDMHGRLAYEEYKGTPSSYGSAREKTLIDNEKQNNPKRTVIALDAGDAFQGLPISNQSKGEDMAKAMNKIGYKAMAAGNHEFDFGLDTVEKYKNNTSNGGWLNFPILSTNVYKDGKRLFKPSTIVTENGVKIGIVGVTTPETATKTNPVGIKGVTFTKPIPEVTEEIKRIKNNVDFVVVLAHLGDDTTTLDDEKGSTLAASLKANPSFKDLSILVIDGHSHQLVQDKKSEPVQHVQAKSYLEYIGKMTFNFNKNTKKIEDFKSEMLAAKDYAKNLIPNADVEKIVKAAQAEFDKKGSAVVIDKAPYTLEGTSENVRTKETNLGNLIADALYNAKVFKNVLDAQGKPQLGSNGGFLQSSSSVKVGFDPHKKPGERVYSIEILNKQTGKFEALDPQKTYYMATNDFLAVGGDGYTMLGGAREEGGATMDSIVVEYLKQLTNEQFLQYKDPFPYSRIIPGVKSTEPVNPGKDDDHKNPPVDDKDSKKTKEFGSGKPTKDNVKKLPNTGIATDTTTVGVGLLLTTSLLMTRRKNEK